MPYLIAIRPAVHTLPTTCGRPRVCRRVPDRRGLPATIRGVTHHDSLRALLSLDEALDLPAIDVDATGRVRCVLCGSDVVAVAAVGIAGERIWGHVSVRKSVGVGVTADGLSLGVGTFHGWES